MRRLFFNLVLTVFCLVTFATFAGKGPTDPVPAKSNYVVIGAFSYIKNAERFAKYASTTKAMKAEFAMNPARNLYYVYMFQSDDLDTAIATVLKVREDHPDLWDAWVYKGSFSDEEESNPENTISSPVALTSSPSSPDQPELFEPEVTKEETEEVVEVATEIEAEPIEVEKVVPSANIEAEEGFYYLYFNTINKKTMKEVRGRVRIIDPERSKELSTEESHQIVELRDPNNGTKRIKASTQIFGFKEVQHMINLDAPLTDSTSAFVDVVGDSIILDFELERFKKGDVLVMYNVYFFKDAAVMKPESKYELLSLLDMLEENDNLKVRIHGHTNGNASGKIIHMDEEKNFFSLVAEQEEDFGSAKKLSQFRAETIQDWLVEQGVNPERMSVRGWGGKKMIYGKHDTQAHKNVRVEIEIIEE